MKKATMLALFVCLCFPLEASLLDGLVSHYDLPEAGNDVREDEHGTNDLVVNSTAGLGNTPNGKIGYGQNYSANNYLETSTSSPFAFGDTDFTIAVWVNADVMSNSIQRMIVDKANSATGREFRVDWRSSPNRFRFIAFDVNDNYVIVETTQTLQAGVWYLIVATHDALNNQISIKVNDGTPVTAEFIGGIQSTTTNSKFAIGSKSGIGAGSSSLKWDGRIDHVSIWNRTLTDEDHTLLYNEGAGLSYTVYGSVGSGGEPPPPPSGSLDIGDLHLEFDDAIELDINTLNGVIEVLTEQEAIDLRDFITDWINY